MKAILRSGTPDDFVVATGQPHTVADFARIAFDEVGLSWRDYVHTSDTVPLERRARLVGDATKLRTVTDWRPLVTFEQMVRSMVAAQWRRDFGSAVRANGSK
jgi:GDPmannose 4,6-dehydratase